MSMIPTRLPMTTVDMLYGGAWKYLTRDGALDDHVETTYHVTLLYTTV
jgi:hypothetical protein